MFAIYVKENENDHQTMGRWGKLKVGGFYEIKKTNKLGYDTAIVHEGEILCAVNSMSGRKFFVIVDSELPSMIKHKGI